MIVTNEQADQGLIAALDSEGLTAVPAAFDYAGGEDLSKPGLAHRRRTRLTLRDADGRECVVYLKRYGREAPGRRLKRWWMHRRGGSEARIEYENVLRVREAGFPTMQALRFGEQGGAGRSFIVVTAVPGDALERTAEDFLASASEEQGAGLTELLGDLAWGLHERGLFHRDLYASHIFLDARAGGDLSLWLIDLARMIRRRPLARRWRVKDLAGIRYSMPSGWVERDWAVFLDAAARDLSPGARARPDRSIRARVERMNRRARRKASEGANR